MSVWRSMCTNMVVLLLKSAFNHKTHTHHTHLLTGSITGIFSFATTPPHDMYLTAPESSHGHRTLTHGTLAMWGVWRKSNHMQRWIQSSLLRDDLQNLRYSRTARRECADMQCCTTWCNLVNVNTVRFKDSYSYNTLPYY